MHRNRGEHAKAGGLFTDGDPQTGVPRSKLESDSMNTIQEELANAVEHFFPLDTELDEAQQDDSQLKKALELIHGKTFNGDPNGNVAADVLRERCWDLSTSDPDLYISTVADGTAAGSVWRRFKDIVAPEIRWTTPIQVGSPLSIPGMIYTDVCALTPSLLAIVDEGNGMLRAVQWDGGGFTILGSLAISGMDNPTITKLTDTDLVLFDNGNDQLRIYRWDGSTFSQVGSGLTVSGTGACSLSAINATTFAFLDFGNKTLRMYQFNGSLFSQVGGGLLISGIGIASIAALNATEIAIASNADDLRVCRWNGSSFSTAGTPHPISGMGTPSITALNSTDIALTDQDRKILTILRWSTESNTWSEVAVGAPLAGVSQHHIAAINGTDIALADSSSDELRLYRYGFQIGSMPHLL